MLEVVSKAWQEVWPEEIAAGFLRCGISNSLDGSEDELLDSQVQSLLFGEQITPVSSTGLKGIPAATATREADAASEWHGSDTEAGILKLHFSDDSRLLDENELTCWST